MIDSIKSVCSDLKDLYNAFWGKPAVVKATNTKGRPVAVSIVPQGQWQSFQDAQFQKKMRHALQSSPDVHGKIYQALLKTNLGQSAQK